MTRPLLVRTSVALLAGTAFVALSGGSSPAAPAGATTARSHALVGTFALSPGRYANRRASGSYFRMMSMLPSVDPPSIRTYSRSGYPWRSTDRMASSRNGA